MRQPLVLKDVMKGLSGRVELSAIDPKTGLVVARRKRENLVVTVGRYLVADLLIATYGTGLHYCGIGVTDTEPDLLDVALASEHSRRVVTLGSRTDNEAALLTYFPRTESDCYIKEAGMFGGLATMIKDSGMLFCRGLIAYDNSAGTYDVSILWTVTVG
jgi:hypothetical protein